MRATESRATESIELSKEEIRRYSRHLILPEFTIQGQRRLKAAKVLVVGSGGLGSPLLQYLAAAGVGTIGIVDHDHVDESNLQRQVLFDVQAVGQPKVKIARERILALNPHLEVHTYQERLSSENALDIIRDYDLVADGTDNFPTRYLVNDACVLLDKVNVYASVYQFEGQVSVFHYPLPDGSRGPNYRDLFPSPPPPGMVPSCAEGGVLGVLPGIIGSLQALEAIKVLSGVGEPLAGKLFLFDALSFEHRLLRIPPHKENPLTGDHPTQTTLIDYEQFCGVEPAQGGPTNPDAEALPSLSAREFEALRTRGEPYLLLDVREPYEYEIVNLSGKLVPLGELARHIADIPRDRKVIVHCRSGVRSARAIALLQAAHGFTNLYNLTGGVLAYAREVDPRLPIY